MQLKEKLDFGFLRSKKQTMFKVAFSLILFLLVFGVSYFIMWLARFLNLFSAFYRIPLSFMAFVYFVIFVMNTITCTIGLSKTFYYSKDNQLLVTFPVNPNALFFSKLLVYLKLRNVFTLLCQYFGRMASFRRSVSSTSFG